MRIIRILGNLSLWIGACLGIVAGAVWIGGQVGLVQPLIVISGSMQPGIETGDLLIDRWVSTENLEVGDVVSLPSELTGKLVTHRIVAIAPQDDMWEIRMKGDDNADEDLEPYLVGDEVLQPALQIPHGGTVVSKLMDPTVALPILLALVALLGLSLLDEPQRTHAARDDELLDPDQADDDVVDARLDDHASAEAATVLDELDLALAALGVDIANIDDPANQDQPGNWEVVWPDDDDLGVDLMGQSHDDDRELVLTG